jgi:hypothetical protein
MSLCYSAGTSDVLHESLLLRQEPLLLPNKSLQLLQHLLLLNEPVQMLPKPLLVT